MAAATGLSLQSRHVVACIIVSWCQKAHQAKLSASCTPYSVSGTQPAPLFHAIHDDTPISEYSTVHAGPNTQSGGVQLGFFRLLWSVCENSACQTRDAMKRMITCMIECTHKDAKPMWCT